MGPSPSSSSSSLRYVFDCGHKKEKKVESVAVFEMGLRLPARICKDCLKNK